MSWTLGIVVFNKEWSHPPFGDRDGNHMQHATPRIRVGQVMCRMGRMCIVMAAEFWLRSSELTIPDPDATTIENTTEVIQLSQ